ncbi:hypothetical protein GOP47_0003814 [Adiantum capillus-veneris]|uniref:Uncharacterized protein n=1 Tax=Adiantum capillus-veneris TaxID=13818 RepID=A0A9D4V7D7_ADICA|nr:hypothetical protein GOP47_0003814 [Adiantum capillus-veneris]
MAVSVKSENYPFPRRNSNSNFSSKRNPSGNFSDVQSDIVISVDGVNFSLHKYPLLSRSGRIRKLAEELNESDSLANPMLEFANFPGGPDAFELAAKFCYGMNFDITASNVAHLRCAAEFLEMTEEYGEDNLITRSEAFLEEIILDSVEKSAQVLHACESILTWAEEVRIVNRCIDAIASKVCKEQLAYTLTRLEYNSSGRSNKLNNDGSSPLNVHSGGLQYKATVEWWADDISSLRVDLYQRVLAAMKSRGLRVESIGGSLMHYAQKVLKPLNKRKQGGESNGNKAKTRAFSYGVVNSKAMEHEQRILVESIVSMLPADGNLFPTNFLLTLLRTAIILDTTVACQLDLEKRVSAQLEHASVDDILIPTFSNAGESLFDVDVVQRVLATYLQQEESQERVSSSAVYDTDDLGSPSRRGLLKVSKLIDMYLAEIAPDANLKVSKFLSLVELLPDYSRVIDDGLYRAIDIFLKAHPTMSDLDRKKVCKLLDCQKLSQEACAHAAQNERLPVQLVVQVLYFEQLRMRTAMGGTRGVDDDQQQQSPSSGDAGVFYGKPPAGRPRRLSGGPMSSPRVESTANMRNDNRELKLEVARLRLRVNDLEKENAALKEELALRPPAVMPVSTSGNSGFFSMFSRKLGKINFFSTGQARSSPRARSGKQQRESKTPRLRRHSIS